MNLEEIDHTAIAVRDLDEALARYRRLFGLVASERTVIPGQGVEVAFLPVGVSKLELIQPVDHRSGVTRFLERRGEGLHHIGVVVSDIDEELARLASLGVELIDETPRPGPHGRIAFIHPRGTGGVLVELMQRE